ncbi:MAG: hypothetical protein JXA09_18125 [Anaerolineae bacterium]|nr:hypothetical protein [Anaerolineae bacterium]
MPAPNKNAIGHTCLAIALAAAAIAAALWYAGAHAAPTGAVAHAAAPVATQADCPWPATTPLTTVITWEPYTWAIASHGVTITFGPNYLFGDQQVIVTFAPQCEAAPVASALIASYPFSLTAAYLNGAPVSFGNDYEIALHYDSAYIGEIDEETLRFYYYDTLAPSKGWLAQSSTVDPVHDLAECTTRQTGLFALGGYHARVFLPLLLRAGGP